MKKDFPIFKDSALVYLDSAATAQKPQSVIDAISHFYAAEYGTVHRAVYSLAAHSTEKYNAVREQVRRFLNAEHREEIVFTKSTTEALNLIAATFPFQPGDEILISEMEHHSNIVPWQLACARTGAQLKVIPISDTGEILLDAYKKLLSPRTKLVSVAHISNVLGTLNPIAEMAALAHAHGAKIVVDGAQSVAHLPVDVQKLDVDFFAFSGHKAYGPTGIGVLYGKKTLLEMLPPYQGGGDMVETVTFEKTTYQKPPLKFEAGTPQIAEVIGLGAAIDYLNHVGLSTIGAHEHKLLQEATQKLLEIPGLRILGTAPNKSAIISFVIEGIHPLDLGTLLDVRGIAVRTGHHCAQPLLRRFGLTAATRVSFGIYNTSEDIGALIRALKEILNILK